jgi:dolichol kinase
MSELASMERKNLPIISFITRHAASETELREFATAPAFFALGILFTLLLFPIRASASAIMIFALGDSTASIFGKILGKKTLPYNKAKTLEGSLTGFVFAFVGSIFLISPFKALLASAFAMIIESLPLPVNDNLVTPILTGALLTFAM